MMPATRTVPFVTLDVFTDTRFGGNPLVIFPDARGLDLPTMQALSKEFNLSESAFVLPPADPANDALVRIFTSDIELDFAGHPNVGVGWLLAERGLDRSGVLRFEQGAGLVEITIERTAGTIARCQVAAPLPVSLGVAPPRVQLAACAGLDAGEIGVPFLASVALNTVCVPVSRAALARARCNPQAFAAIAADRPDLSRIFLLFLFAREGDTVWARMFAPLSGTIEDPATGSAASACTAALLLQSGAEMLALDIVQGMEMGRPSRMRCVARRQGDEVRAWVSGACVPVLRGTAEI
jgi:trans-2,3-dihydro-3-hydroxyanthranilate isomerase